MSDTDYTKFKGITNIGNDTLMTILENNLKSYYDWSLLGVGGWMDVEIPQSGGWGGDYSTLRMVSDPAYTDGQVWEGARKDWVWETGVEWSGAEQPISITGVEVDGTNRGFNDSGYEHHVNYPLGRIIFDTAIETTSVVKCSYSQRSVQVYVADNAPWFQELQFRSYRVDSSHYNQTTTGDWSIGAQHRSQMPAIIIEAVSRGRSRPYELGNGSLVKEQDVLFHVVAETRSMRNTLLDIISQQNDKQIWLFNTNTVADDSAYPLDYRGMLSGTNMYPDLVGPDSEYRWRKCFFKNANISEVESINPNLYQGVVRVTAEIIIGGSA